MLQHRQVFEGLDQIVGGTQAQGFHRIVHHPGAGHHDHRQVVLTLADQPDELQTVHLRHAQIADHQIGTLGIEQLQSFRSAGCLQNPESAVIQIGSQAGSNHIVVIYDQ